MSSMKMSPYLPMYTEMVSLAISSWYLAPEISRSIRFLVRIG